MMLPNTPIARGSHCTALVLHATAKRRRLVERLRAKKVELVAKASQPLPFAERIAEGMLNAALARAVLDKDAPSIVKYTLMLFELYGIVQVKR